METISTSLELSDEADAASQCLVLLCSNAGMLLRTGFAIWQQHRTEGKLTLRILAAAKSTSHARIDTIDLLKLAWIKDLRSRNQGRLLLGIRTEAAESLGALRDLRRRLAAEA